MPLSDVIVNGTPVSVSRYFLNSPSEDACERFGLDAVDMDVIHTDLTNLTLDVVCPTTYGLVFYVPAELDLGTPVFAPVGARLTQSDPTLTRVEPFTYKNHRYKIERDSLELRGEIGCTAAVNLGLCLLSKYRDIDTDRLGVLFLFDQTRLRDMDELDLPVDDDPIDKFCDDYHRKHIAYGSD